MFGRSLGWHLEDGAARRHLHLPLPLAIITALSE
jgi:hypothetical protein